MSTTTHQDLKHAMTPDLRRTVIAGWYARLADNPSRRRNRWQTKTLYYRAVTDLLGQPARQALTWKNIVGAARPRGCRSTFYEVAGMHARDRMVDDLIADGRIDSIQIALSYQREEAVEQLIDETKVWSFWPYRQYLIDRVLTPDITPERAANALTRTAVIWARRNAALAAAIDHCPPACAVEDMTVLHQGRLAPTRAAGRLTDTLRQVIPSR